MCICQIVSAISLVFFSLLLILNFFQASSSASSTEKNDAEAQEEKSEIYSNNMTEAMGAGKFNDAI